jgi:hypothetical protein
MDEIGDLGMGNCKNRDEPINFIVSISNSSYLLSGNKEIIPII